MEQVTIDMLTADFAHKDCEELVIINPGGSRQVFASLKGEVRLDPIHMEIQYIGDGGVHESIPLDKVVGLRHEFPPVADKPRWVIRTV